MTGGRESMRGEPKGGEGEWTCLRERDSRFEGDPHIGRSIVAHELGDVETEMDTEI